MQDSRQERSCGTSFAELLPKRVLPVVAHVRAMMRRESALHADSVSRVKMVTASVARIASPHKTAARTLQR